MQRRDRIARGNMWTDHETESDFLNFGAVARTVAEIIVQSNGRPISIGVSGAWGVGKSSMIKLIRSALQEENSSDENKQKFVFVEFNAWLYQGYDDARAALLEVVASSLADETKNNKGCLQATKDKTVELLKRVNWFRLAKVTAGSAAAAALGLPPVGLIGEVFELGKKAVEGHFDKDAVGKVDGTIESVGTAATGLLNAKVESTPPKEIHAIRKSFEETLEEMGVTLVVLIDDLDRCLPETTISTLEAIRLLLFLKHTAFVIAADDQMIKHAVKRHFQGVDDDLVTNYFDKLIQVPIRVPPLGTQEVRAYMMMLFVDNSTLDSEEKERIRTEVCKQLGGSWQGKRVDLKFLRSLNKDLSEELIAKLDTADRLAPLMASATGIHGNPRLVKRFLNALSIRMAMSKAQGVGVDESVLAKVLLFERCADPKAYAALTKCVTDNPEGKPVFLAHWETKAIADEDLSNDLKAPWDAPFILDWLRLPPSLGDRDLRGVLYVSREHAPLIMPEDRLSSDAVDILTALLEHPDMANSIKDRLALLPKNEVSVIMDRLLDRARQEQEWGVPPILEACMVVSEVDSTQGQRLAGFLCDRPTAQIKANIIPKIADQQWSGRVLNTWESAEVSKPVRTAIKQRKQNGDIAVK